MRKLGGYGAAAIAVTPHLLIKLAWTFGILLPGARMGQPSWRAVNATTALLGLVGVLLGLAFSRPWGQRLPAWLVVPPARVGTGLLVPMVLLAPVLGPAAATRDQAAGAAPTWSIEQLLVVVSLVGVGVGLPVAFAGYATARWPQALGGPLDAGDAPGYTRQLQRPLARIVAVGCLPVGLTKLYWALGGTIGIDPGRLADRDLWWHAVTLSAAVWSLAGAWAIVVLTARRGARRFAFP